MTALPVAVLDDNQDFLDDALVALEQVGIPLHKYTEPAAFEHFVVSDNERLVLFVDHDLGTHVTGYDVIRKIRTDRSDGLIVPIVYMTGRESEQGFLAAEAADPYAAPSLYLNKRALIDTDLVELVERLSTQYSQALGLARDQATREAIRFFGELPPDSIAQR